MSETSEAQLTGWQTCRPPHRVVVEVEDDDRVIRVRAVWGDSNAGVLPHWESEDRGTLYYPDSFGRWRHLEEDSRG